MSLRLQACTGCRLVALASLVTLVVAPAEAAIAVGRSSVDFQQLYHREGRGRSDSSEKSVEDFKPRIPALVIDDPQDSPISDVDQQLIPDPLPPVFDEELALSAPRRLDVVQEAGAELPWPIGSYNAHVRGISVADSLELPHIRRHHTPIPESPDQRHRYMHSILHGYGDENFAGPFGA